MKTRFLPLRNLVSGLALCLPFSAIALDFETVGSGNWNDTSIWSPGGTSPLTGAVNGDNATIQAGHNIIFTGPNVGIPGSADLGVANGNTLTINGGTLTQSSNSAWVRIGDASAGTAIINDGAWFYTNNSTPYTSGSPVFNVGYNTNSNGVLIVGDGIGSAGSAILSMNHRPDGLPFDTNVRLDIGIGGSGARGSVIVNSDGLIEGQANNSGSIRVGVSANSYGELIVNAGGQVNSRHSLILGDSAGATGIVKVDGSGAIFDNALRNKGSVITGVAGNATGEIHVLNGGQFYSGKEFTVGHLAGSKGLIVVDGQNSYFRQGANAEGASGLDMRIGNSGTGTILVKNGGLFEKTNAEWTRFGDQSNSHGTLLAQDGGQYIDAGNVVVFGMTAGSRGDLVVDGGLVDIKNVLRIGVNGNSMSEITSGELRVGSTLAIGDENGYGELHLSGGTINAGSFRLGGSATNTVGSGTGRVIQTGGTINSQGVGIVGLAANHQGFYDLQGGTFNLVNNSDFTVGESGTGTLTIGENGTLNLNGTGGNTYIGRNANSKGTLYVDGTFNRHNQVSAPIRVGDVNATGKGTIGGKGVINAPGGIHIGSAGTITGGRLKSEDALLGVGTLTLNSDLSFASGGKYQMDFNANSENDSLRVNGTVNLNGANLLLGWDSGAQAGEHTRYWSIINDGSDAITGRFGNTLAVGADSLFPDADAWYDESGQLFALFYSANYDTGSLTGGNDLLLVAVPEPSKAVLLMLSGTLLAFARRRKLAA